MKNKLYIFFILCSIFCDVSYADQFKFETSTIEIADGGNIVYAKNGKAISRDKNLEIEAAEFEYSKEPNILKAFNGVAFFKNDNLKIEFGEINLNQSTLITTASKNVKILELDKDIIIETDSLIFDKKKNILKSSSPTILKDKENNFLSSKYFEYNLDDSVLKLKEVILKDFNNNNFEIKIAYLDTISNKLIGNDISVVLNNKSFDKNNDPRIKGRSIVYDNQLTEVTKGVFTTCKKTDKCPPWQLMAEKIQHDPEKQIINYKNAFLKVYNIPVMYFPKFFHPDPTVDRKSGFLIPSVKNSDNSTSYLSLPYFSAISQNKDMTFTPRFYSDKKILLQSEYRQENENSSHVSDMSIFNEKGKSSKTHFFYKYNKLIELANFEDGNLNLKIEKTSNDTYLRKNKLTSPLMSNLNVLENTLALNLYSENLSLNSEFKVYEDLDKENNDRYEFILPSLDIVKKLDNKTNLNGNFLIETNNFIRSYATNIMEKVNINNFIFNSYPKITDSGFYNNYDFIIKNINTDTKNSSNYKKDNNYFVSGLFQFNSSLPLKKEKGDFLNIMSPKLSLKVSPNNTKDISKSDGNRLDVNNIYNFNRLGLNNALEGGTSLTIGNDFSIFDYNKSREIFSLKLANNLRLEENHDLPKANQLGGKNSNFFGELKYSPNEILTTQYNASAKNNLTDINYENFIAEISLNNFVTSFDYLNENNFTNRSSYLTNSVKYKVNEFNNISFSTRENKSSNLTEYYNLIYEYKNDCLAASIEYNKDYYDDRDIKPEESIFFKLTIIPFGETSSPNLKE